MKTDNLIPAAPLDRRELAPGVQLCFTRRDAPLCPPPLDWPRLLVFDFCRSGRRAIPDGEMVTFSVWAVSGLSGLLFDLEPCYIANYGRYTGRLSLSTNIGEEQLKVIEDYMEQHDKWTVDKNCSYWSIHLWNAVVGEDAALKIRGFVCTPEKIEQAFSAFDGVEVNKDFSRAGGIYCYKDGERTELQLCS